MRLGLTIFLAVVSALALAVPLTTASAQNAGDLLGDAERGRALFVDYTSYGCHGYSGETGSGTRLSPPRMNQARFIAYLRNPSRPTQMPPYRQDEVSDQNLAAVYAFISSLESGSPDAESIPVLDAILDEVDR